MNFLEVVRDTLSFFGLGAIVFGLSKFLGRVWENRIKEREALGSQKIIEREKAQIDVGKIQPEKFANSQYGIYEQLWGVLSGLLWAVEALWERASDENIAALAERLLSARKNINEWSLYIEEKHLKDLKRMLGILENFWIGKKQLIDIRSKSEVVTPEGLDVKDQIDRQIQTNNILRGQLKKLLEEIRASFQKKLASQ